MRQAARIVFGPGMPGMPSPTLRRRAQFAAIGDCPIRLDVHVELQRFEARLADFDAVATAIELERLPEAVEVVYLSGEVAIHVDLGIARRDFDLQRADVVAALVAVAAAVAVAVGPVRIAVERRCLAPR